MNMLRGKIIKENTTIDVSTGEIIKQSTESIVPKEPNFIKLYLEDLVMLKDVPKWVSGILYELLKRMNYQNEIVLNSEIKRRIAGELEIVPKTIDNALVTFVKKKILIRTGKGIYIANPYLFGKGDWNNVRGIRLSVSYSLGEGKTLNADISKNEKEVQSNSES